MKSDMYRLSRNVGLYVSPLIATFLIAQEAFGIGLVEIISGEAKNHCVEFFNMTVYFSPLMLLTPFLASIPYAAVFCEDANSGYLQFALHRNVYLKAYTRTKYFAVWTSGFLVISIPLMVFGIICVAFAAPYTEQYILENGNQLQDTAWEILGTVFDGKAVIFSQIFFFSCFSASCSVIALAASAYLPNPFFTWCFPVILAYGGNFLFSKLHLGFLNLYYSFDPVYDVLHFSSDTAGILYMLAYHATVFLVCYVLFYLGVKRRVGGGELRICVDAKKKWKRNPRVICAFLVLLLLCLTMTSEYVDYSKEIGLSIQVFEPFILMFTQRYSLLFIMLILLLLYQDVPFIDDCTPYLLIRKTRFSWAMGQILYICFSTLLILIFALLVCVLSGFSVGYFQNIWSDTAWFTAYGGALNESAPIEITLIENLNPYVSVACIMALFFFGTLALNTILFSLNLWKGKFVGLCVVASLIFMGYLFSADLILKEWSGWLSIACHVNLAQHQLTGTGSDPKIGQSILLLLSISLCSFAWTCKLAKNFNFFIGEKE